MISRGIHDGNICCIWIEFLSQITFWCKNMMVYFKNVYNATGIFSFLKTGTTWKQPNKKFSLNLWTVKLFFGKCLTKVWFPFPVPYEDSKIIDSLTLVCKWYFTCCYLLKTANDSKIIGCFDISIWCFPCCYLLKTAKLYVLVNSEVSTILLSAMLWR